MVRMEKERTIFMVLSRKNVCEQSRPQSSGFEFWVSRELGQNRLKIVRTGEK